MDEKTPEIKDGAGERPKKVMPLGQRFLPGRSGNPGGRPKGLATRAREATNDGQSVVDFMRAVMDGEVKGSSVRDRIEAGKWLSDRGHGRAVETTVQVQADAREAQTGALGDLVDAELEMMARQLKESVPATLVATSEAPGSRNPAESFENPETTD